MVYCWVTGSGTESCADGDQLPIYWHSQGHVNETTSLNYIISAQIVNTSEKIGSLVPEGWWAESINIRVKSKY
jgi:hypothetical protein